MGTTPHSFTPHDPDSGADNRPAPGPAPIPEHPAESSSEAPAAEGEETFSMDDVLASEGLDEYGQYSMSGNGEAVRGYVVKVTDKEVLVDIGAKSEGSLPISQLPTVDGKVTVQPGDTLEVVVEHGQLTPEGYVVLSHHKASNSKAWDDLDEALKNNAILTGKVTGRTKGGLMVDVGVEAFMPGSQVDVRPVYNVEAFIGQEIPVRVVKLNRRRGNAVVSRKLAIEEDVNARKAALLDGIQEGGDARGTVKNLTEYGAFIDLGGIDGLLHVSDMSHGRVTHPSEVVQVGQELTLRVLKFDRGKERISLGLKQMLPDPWATVIERYQPGTRVVGRVVSVTDYGSFVELESGVEGLIHISEMTWSRRMKHPSKVVKPGDQVESVVLEVKSRDRRISLGIKQLEDDPWTTVASRYAIGSVVEGRVRKLSDFGAFIEIEEGIDGLVHVSDLSWTKHIKHPSELLKKGQVVQAVILQIDAPTRRLSLGMKQLQPDAWESFFQAHKVGDLVKGRVCRASAFGIFVEVAPGVEALCHNSEVPGYQRGQESKTPALPVKEEFTFKVIRLNAADKKIGLSLKAVAEDEERIRLADYQKQAAAATSTIEEALRKDEPSAAANDD
ncbi:MAG: 30S ribosomal protein S1 [Acidobacteriota bacterium]|jgi:small subunit ribosomal protein S1|nr:30S ribosomal protein S1 [Bryobacteraceae bacterium CoA2 C42]